MRSVFAGALLAIALLALTPMPTSAADQIFCGNVLGFQPATASASGQIALTQPVPAGTRPSVGPSVMITIPPGGISTFPSGWVCVRATVTGSTNTFVAVVPPGAPGFLSPPTPGPSASGGREVSVSGAARPGTLPNTSTTDDSAVNALGIGALALLVLVSARRLAHRR